MLLEEEALLRQENSKRSPADTVIAAVGEKVPTALYEANGINVNDRGRALVNEETLETNVENVYVVGDGLGGPATVVEGIRDGLKAAQAVIGETLVRDFDAETDEAVVYERKGNLEDVREDSAEAKRCLNCAGICENCKEVCPNRANVAIKVPGLEKHQIIHVDTCVMNVVTVRASVHTTVLRTWINSHYSWMRTIWQTARIRDSQYWIKMQYTARFVSVERSSTGHLEKRQRFRKHFRK